MMTTGTALSLVTASAGGLLVFLFGEWDFWLKFLLVMMFLDIVTGLMKTAYQRSEKTNSGGFKSSIFIRGLITKGAMLAVIIIAVQVDMIFIETGQPIELMFFGTVRNAVILFLWLGEVFSILENCGQMGVPMPKPLIKFLDVLHQQLDDTSKK